jgi:hypothetical protein
VFFANYPPATASTIPSQPPKARPGPSLTQSSSGDTVTTGAIVAAVVLVVGGLIGAAVIYWSLVIRSATRHAPHNDKAGTAELGSAVELDVITTVPQSHTAPHAGAVEALGGKPVPGNRA